MGMVFDQVPGAVLAGGLLVADQAQDHVTGWDQSGRPGAHEGGHHHCDPALHIQRSPSPDAAICHCALKGRMGPHLVSGGHYVDVTVHEQRWCVAAPRQAGDQVWAGLVLGEDRSLESGRRQHIAGVGDAGRFAAWWVGGIETDEVLQQFHGAPARGRPVLCCGVVRAHGAISAVAEAITTGWLDTCS